MSYLDHSYAVVLAGGGGTRLWPKSRKKTPKQFLKLVDTRTMMQMSVDRITKLIPPERVIVVTNQLYRDEVVEQLPEVPSENIIAEPEKKDTALAMLTGSLFAYNLDNKAIIINCASDHTLHDEEEFVRVMKAAAQTASEKPNLVTVGITPTFPSSGFGYIKIGEDLERTDQGLPLFKVDNFTEKPNTATAQAFISTGKYFWNANMYVWSAESLIEAFNTHMPSLHKKTKPLVGVSTSAFHDALKNVYKDADAISIDYAISEKADNLVLIPGDFGWNDVGDWKVVYDISQKNADGNVIISDDDHGETIAIHSNRNIVHTNNRTIAMLGVSDMVVVDTEEIVLLIPKERSQEVKKIVEQLKADRRDDLL